MTKRGEVYKGWLSDQLRKINSSGDLVDQLINQVNGLLKDCEINPSRPNEWLLERIMLKYDQILELIEQFIYDLNN